MFRTPSTQRRYMTVIVFVAFTLALCGSGTYLWSTQRSYRAQIPEITEQLDNIPPPGNVSRAIVMAKTKGEQIDWALNLAPEWFSYVYSTDEEAGYSLRLPVNKGREAMAYLTFIIDNYDSLPEYTAFVHASAVQWHNDVVGDKTADILKDLRLDTIQRKGYVNLRCHLSPGCPFSVFPLSPSETDIKVNDVRAYFANIYKELFNVTQEQVPEQIGSVCCAQFALSRDRIRNRSREDYVRMREWAIHTQLDTFGVGWVFEMVWHIVFGEKPLQLVHGQRAIEKQIC